MSWKTVWKQYKTVWRKLGSKILLCAVLALLVIANMVFPSIESRDALRVDVTKNDIYTLSEQTKGVLHTLQQNIYLYVVYSPGNEDIRLQELVAEYGAHCPYVQVNMLSAEMLKSAEGLTGVSAMQDGLIIANEAGDITKTFSLEELYITDEAGNPAAFRAEAKITATIQGMLQGSFCNVRILTGHGEMPAADMQSFLQMLDMANFQVAEYNLSVEKEPLNADTDLLVIVSPKADLEHSEYEAISQFMNDGGRLLLFIDKASFNTTQGVLQLYTTELPLFTQLLADYNIVVNDDLIVTRDADAINLRRTSFGAQPVMHDVTAPLYGAELKVVVHEAASLRFLYGGEAKVSQLLSADADCFAKPLKDEINSFHFEAGDKAGNFFIGALSSKKDSQLAIITDSLCIANEAFSVDGNYLFFDGLIHTMAPIKPPSAIESKEIHIPQLSSGAGLVQMVVAFGCLVVMPAVVLYLGTRVRSGKRKHKK